MQCLFDLSSWHSWLSRQAFESKEFQRGGDYIPAFKEFFIIVLTVPSFFTSGSLFLSPSVVCEGLGERSSSF